MGPKTRQALHLALDMVLDAIVEDAEGKPPQRAKRARRALRISSAPITADDLKRAVEAGREAGFF